MPVHFGHDASYTNFPATIAFQMPQTYGLNLEIALPSNAYVGQLRRAVCKRLQSMGYNSMTPEHMRLLGGVRCSTRF